MVRNLSRRRKRLGRRFVAFLAIQIGTHILIASGDGEHPRTIRERRLMPDVLSMTTGQIGDPVTILILVISDDRLLHIAMTFLRLERRWNRGTTVRSPRLSLRRPLVRPSTFLERQLGSLGGGKISPPLTLVLVEASDKNHVSIEVAKFGEARSATQCLDDARIILPDHIDSSLRRSIDVASAGIARIRKQFSGRKTAVRPLDVQGEIESLEEWVRRHSHDRQLKPG